MKSKRLVMLRMLTAMLYALGAFGYAHAVTVYFDAKNEGGNDWSTPTVHYWGSSGSTYPGVAMEHVAGWIYKYDLPAGTTGMLFNGGGTTTQADRTKTGDMTPTDGHDYNRVGDRGTHVPSALYMIGNVDGAGWSTSTGTQLTRSGSKYTGEVIIDNASGGYGTFSFATKLGSNWDVVNTSARYGEIAADYAITGGTPTTIYKYDTNADPGATKSWKAKAGAYLVTVDFADMTVLLQPITVTLNKSSATLSPGQKVTLEATVTPADAADLLLTWSSSNPAVASPNYLGVVTGVSSGTAVITARYGTKATATCTVTVKNSQTIEWTQDLSNIKKGQTVPLTATASSGLAVSYTVTNGTSVAEIVEGTKLRANGSGIVTVMASQAGNDTYAPAESVFHTFAVGLDYTPGDLNGDNNVNSTDLVLAIDHILGRSTLANIDAVDLDGNGQVNIVDITRLINIILKQ